MSPHVVAFLQARCAGLVNIKEAADKHEGIEGHAFAWHGEKY
jgi:hypothetical protein